MADYGPSNKFQNKLQERRRKRAYLKDSQAQTSILKGGKMDGTDRDTPERRQYMREQIAQTLKDANVGGSNYGSIDLTNKKKKRR